LFPYTTLFRSSYSQGGPEVAHFHRSQVQHFLRKDWKQRRQSAGAESIKSRRHDQQDDHTFLDRDEGQSFPQIVKHRTVLRCLSVWPVLWAQSNESQTECRREIRDSVETQDFLGTEQGNAHPAQRRTTYDTQAG